MTQHYVRPDLGSNCLQGLSADNTGKELMLLKNATFLPDNLPLNRLHNYYSLPRPSVFSVKYI